MKFTPSLCVLFALCVWMATGCGTIIHGTTQDISVSTEPANATIWVDGVEMGKTPTTLNLRRKHDHTIRISKEGYKDTEVKIESSTSGALFGNIIFGGLIGCIVDLSNGAAYSLSPDEIKVNIQELDKLEGRIFHINPDEAERIKRVRFIDESGETEFLIKINWED